MEFLIIGGAIWFVIWAIKKSKKEETKKIVKTTRSSLKAPPSSNDNRNEESRATPLKSSEQDTKEPYKEIDKYYNIVLEKVREFDSTSMLGKGRIECKVSDASFGFSNWNKMKSNIEMDLKDRVIGDYDLFSGNAFKTVSAAITMNRRANYGAVMSSFLNRGEIFRYYNNFSEDELRHYRIAYILRESGFISDKSWKYITFAFTVQNPLFQTTEKETDQDRYFKLEVLKAINTHGRSGDDLLKDIRAIFDNVSRIEDDPWPPKIIKLIEKNTDMTNNEALSDEANDTMVDLLLGLNEQGKPAYFNGEGSLLSIGGPGSGKTQCHVRPIINQYEGSALILDMKGDLLEQIYNDRCKEMRQHTVFFDPANREHSYQFNPLSEHFISRDPYRLFDDARRLASMLIPSGSSNNQFWIDSARNIVTSMITAVIIYEYNTGTPATMAPIMLWLMGGPALKNELIPILKNSELPSAREGAEQLISLVEGDAQEMLAGILQNARSAMDIWRSDGVKAITSKQDWDPRLLRVQPTTIVFRAPFDDPDTYKSVMRAFVGLHIQALMPATGKQIGDTPVLFLLDEMPALGEMKAIERAVFEGRSFGIRTWMFAQNEGQIIGAYGEQRGKALIGSAQVRNWFTLTPEEAEVIAKQLGSYENMFTGQKKQRYEGYQLVGPDFGDKIIGYREGKGWFFLDKLPFWKIQQAMNSDQTAA